MKILKYIIIMFPLVVFSKEVGISQPEICDGLGYTLGPKVYMSKSKSIYSQKIICNKKTDSNQTKTISK